MKALSDPVYHRIDYDRVAALRAAIQHEFPATSRRFGAEHNRFVAFTLDGPDHLTIYDGVRGQHPEYGEITVFWPRDTPVRNHGYWSISCEEAA